MITPTFLITISANYKPLVVIDLIALHPYFKSLPQSFVSIFDSSRSNWIS